MTFEGAAVYRMAAPSESLPSAATQNGNVFQDRADANVAWYLPGYALVADPDAAFAFSATQAGVDATGSPFDRATLTLSVSKMVPADVAAYQTANPSKQLREIPLNGLSATLTTTASDPQTGAPRPSTYAGKLAGGSGNSLTLTFDSLVGVGVIVAYENLEKGGASVSFSASYNVWHPQGFARPIYWFPLAHVPPAQPAGAAASIGGAASIDAAQPVLARPMPMEMAIRPILREPIAAPVRPLPVQPVTTQPAAPAPPAGTEGTAQFSATLALATKFANQLYANGYKLTDSLGTRQIVSVNDLTSFQTNESEFSPFTALGDVSQKYPSFSALYIGALSRTIVAIPAHYGIVRSSAGTAAVCQALVDSSAGNSTACKFQFAFQLGPVVSPIDLVQLTKDLAANQASQGCTVVLPTQLNGQTPGSLATPFQTSVSYVPGAQPQTFQLSVEVVDGASNSPAVANANLLIAALTTSVEPFLVGQFAIKLDDYYPSTIDVDVVLNLSVTSGSDDLGFSVDPSSGAVSLSNNSPLDLSLSRYAFVSDGGVAVSALAASLPSRQSIPLPSNGAASPKSVLVDRALALESPFTKAATMRYLQFELQDVQAVQYELGVVAPSVSFSARGIASIAVAVTLTDLPQVTVPGFTLTSLNQAGNEQIQLPIQYALSVLSATIQFTVTPLDTTQAPAQFTLANDFIAQPVFVLSDANIPGFVAATAPSTT